MTIFNRRNAFLGWVAWLVGKRMLKRKLAALIPSVDPESKRPNWSAIALLIASAVGVATFWRRHRSGDDADAVS